MNSVESASADATTPQDTPTSTGTSTNQCKTQQRSNNRNQHHNNQRNNDNSNGNCNRNHQSAMDVSNKNFEGAEPEIGCVLGLKYEKIDKKVTFDVFKEKMCNYIEHKMEFGTEISGLVKDYEDVLHTFKLSNQPTPLIDEDADDEIEKAILKE
jgi:transcription antitermination factor NusG